jgi:hypothetical protein
MSLRSDRTAFLLEDPKRLRVAELCAQQPRSHGELAELMGITPGALSAPTTMRGSRWAALVPAGRGGRRGAQLWRLNRPWRPAVRDARCELDRGVPDQVEGAFAGNDLLLVPLSSIENACRALSDPLQELRWAASIQGEGLGLMLCMSQADHGRAVARVIRRLSAQGVAVPVRLSVEEPMGADALAAWARSVLEDGAPPALRQ